MEIVLTHNNMDFDSLAAQYAVTKLWPNTRIVPGYPLVGNVREFLSLYRDNLPIVQIKYMDLEQIDHIFVVDCQHIERLDETAKKLITEKNCPYTVFDHHPIDPEGMIPGADENTLVRPVGSTTTLLVEAIRKRNLSLSQFEATLFMIGIYEDTGCLTYAGTTPEDAECVAHLLKHGADLARVNEFLHPKMSPAQVELLEKLINESRSFTISGTKVLITRGSRDTYLDGLATLTRKLLEIESADAAVTVVRMKDRVHVVGRSDSSRVDVREIARHFGGDGHTGAASAVVKDGNVDQVAGKVEELLREQVKPEKVAAQIMTAPVRTIKAKTTMEEAGRIMLRYGLDGLIVAEGDEVQGVISRRDIDQAAHHKLSHAPVQGFMSRPVINIGPETPLSEIQRLMIHEDVGRLPVMGEDGHLLGLVTRREVLRTLYGSDGSQDSTMPLAAVSGEHVSLKDKMERLGAPTQWLMEQIGICAAELNMVAYAVGGCVRDLLLDIPNFDLDFVVEGSAIRLAEALEARFPARLQIQAKHDRFQTSTLSFNEAIDREVDLSTARVEFYEFPAALPTVEASSLRQDLFRRDFTINALAVCLNPGRYGELIDYFGGLKDLRDKRIRVLHQFSFIEDPTRIVRAARFAGRLGFKLDLRTKEQAERAIEMGIFDDLAGVRMRTEMQLILESKDRLKSLDLLGQLGGRLGYLDSHLEYGPKVRRTLTVAGRLLRKFPLPDAWIVYLGLLLSQLPLPRLTAVLDRLHLPNEQKTNILKGIALPDQLNSIDGEVKPSQIHALLHGHSDESLAIAACMTEAHSPLRRMIKLYLEELRNIHVTISGADLLRMGFPQGPAIGKALGKLTEAKLDGKVDGVNDEIEFVRSFLQNN
jgi:tRNA nucleotidyltransferase (CCA-adding enzyme)